MKPSYLGLALSLFASAVRAEGDDEANDTPLPVIVWHGLGDSYNNLGPIDELVNRIYEGTYTKIIKLGTSPTADSEASFIGNVSAQVDQVCATLAADNILSTAPAVDALGFSQGGVFLRAYVERCNTPPVRNLVTLGSPHNGITEITCRGNLVCQGLYWLFKLNPFSARVQSTIVPAQYYRPTEDSGKFENYLDGSGLLADINNERELKNKAYADNIANLENFVMVLFEEDTQVVPKESAWFEEVDGPEGVSTPLRARQLYRQDWLGLRALDRKGGLHFRSAPGEHMRFTDEFLGGIVEEFFGPANKTGKANEDSRDYL
jgi:palmitoyl-protein thioesterase